MVREKVINPFVRPLAPSLLWSAEDGEWTDADAEAIDAFTLAHARMNRRRALRNPGEPWLVATAEAAEAWAGHRGVGTG
ncbi:hypothetical protein CUT44_17545 [Streptomyces carminius]|uniref:Uncharacterized protein n=1 Tax=Streptomyces carminius TaxID=2665496 RepID=A0A2M8LWJ9_9ACTN|nr:hypothetical protein [Streptomyces carminius]PJE96337.1 hypothetical protein CUT44_17545 [Streptomyces carminius]